MVQLYNYIIKFRKNESEDCFYYIFEICFINSTCRKNHMELRQIQQEKFSKEQNATCFAIIMITFVAAIFGSSMNLLGPIIGKEFNVSASMLGWIMTSFTIGVAILAIPFGRLADMVGKKRIFVPGVLIFSVFSLMPIFVQSFAMMLVFRIFQAIGGAMFFSTTTAIIANVFPEGKRGKAVGLMIASMYVGLTVGPICAGAMNYYFGWRSMFMLAFALSIVAFVIALKKIPKDREIIEKLNVNILKDIAYVFKFFAGNFVYASLNIIALIASGVGFAIVYLMSIYLQIVMGYSSQTAGFVLIAQAIFMTAFSPYAGKLSDKVSPFKLSALGIAICATGVGLGVFININYPVWLVILALSISGVGFGLFGPSNTIAVMSCVEIKDYGTASAVLVTMRYFGYSSTVAVVSLIAGIYMGNIPLADADIDLLIMTMRASFIVFLILCTIGLLLSVKCSKHSSKEKSSSI